MSNKKLIPFPRRKENEHLEKCVCKEVKPKKDKEGINITVNIEKGIFIEM